MSHDSVSLDVLASDPARAQGLSADERGKLIVQAAAVLAALGAGLSTPAPPTTGDKLLTVNQAAVRLSMSTDYLYRHAAKFPFAVRDGRRLRFSERGIDKWIATRQRLGRLSEST